MLLVALLACPTDTNTGGLEMSATATLSAYIPTVMVVAFDAPSEATSVRVEWGESDTYGQVTEIGVGGTGSGAVVGLHPATDYHWRAVAVTDGGEFAGPDQVITSGSLPVGISDLTVETSDQPTFGYVVTTTLGMSANAVIYDEEGVAVWFMVADEGSVFSEVRVKRDGTGVLLQVMDGYRKSDLGATRDYAWDGSLVSDTRTPGAHHDFVETETGHYGYCGIDVRQTEVDGVATAVVGEAIREIPPGGSEADITTVWTSWDTLPVRVDPVTDGGFYPQGLDWIHCNGLTYEPERQAYTLSAYSLGSIIEIDRATGGNNWVFSGADNEFEIEGGRPFRDAHSPEPTVDGFRLFINRTDAALYSRVARYVLDVDAMTARESESLELDRAYYSYILGDSNALPDGGVLVTWGSAGVITEIDSADQATWIGSARIGTIIGFGEPVRHPGGPLP